MVRAGEHPYHMRSHKTYECDGAADGNADSDEPRHRDQQRQLYAAYINADVTGVLFSNCKSIQFTGVTEDYGAENGQCHAQYTSIVIAGTGQAAHCPESDMLDTVCREGDNDVHEGGNEHGINDADQNYRIGG